MQAVKILLYGIRATVVSPELLAIVIGIGVHVFFPSVEEMLSDVLTKEEVVQCNNNKYGDSRVRMPGKEPWNRDIVRIRGGDDPYYVTVKLNVDELREFQSSFVAPQKKDKFKPLPQGFQEAMASYRKMSKLG